MPAGALLGATAAVAAAALAGLGPVVPGFLRNLAFVIIGLSLGAGITGDILDDIARWPVSLVGLALTIVLTMVITARLLVRGFGVSPDTAALSVSPGALSYAVVLAAQGHGDLRSVVVLQSVRLLLVTLCLPPIIVALAGVAASGPIAEGGAVVLGPLPTIAFVLAGLASGWLVDRAGSPAAYLLAGLVVSGLAHALGWVNGVLPSPVVFSGFVVTGAVIGCRFTGIARSDLVRLAAAGLVATGLSVALSAAGALCVASLTGLSFPVVWVAFAPGGVEGMAAIGLALGYDPAFIATHHIFRIVLVIALLPLAVRLAGR
ncbi:MAG: putative ammonia monooxygenase [Roseibaca calidilacus]|nr:AbrB family transcriptional regulator [Roseibaca calidilacus]KPP89390.1 MAG: putative ammonia monooxygenase [Roseibaca calidilacus]